MKYIYFLILFLILNSCTFFEKKEENLDKKINIEIKTQTGKELTSSGIKNNSGNIIIIGDQNEKSNKKLEKEFENDLNYLLKDL